MHCLGVYAMVMCYDLDEQTDIDIFGSQFLISLPVLIQCSGVMQYLGVDNAVFGCRCNVRVLVQCSSVYAMFGC